MVRSALVLFAASFFVGACSSGRTGRGGDGGPSGTADLAASLTGTVTQTVVTDGTPADAPNQFNGPDDPSVAPKLVYPADGVLMPPNISLLEFQWLPAPGGTVYELRLVSTHLDLAVYTTCKTVGAGCGYQPDAATWTLLSTQARGDTMKVTLRASSGQGTGVGSAATQSLSLTQEDLLGGLYYWAAAAGEIDRYDFGLNGSAETFYSAGESGAICVGCHALARNGQRIAVGLNAPVPQAGLRVLDISTKTALFTQGTSNFESFSPDASRILANDGSGNLNLLDGSTGLQLGTAPVIPSANLPDWSADGTSVVFSRPDASACPIPAFCAASPGVTGGSLYTVSHVGDTFGTPTQIVTGGGNNFYPTYSPDGSLVAFDRSASNQSSFDASDARVFVVSSSGGPALPLTSASASGSDVGDSWPKFAPFSHHFGSDTIFWLTFSSRRDYGLRILNSTKQVTTDSDGTVHDPRISQLWMVGVPASALSTGALPKGGYPAIWLPFQSMTSGNHIAQWTETVPRQPCGTVDGTPCPANQTCENGVCQGVPPIN